MPSGKGVELLYDLKEDPTQFRNIADDPEHQAILKTMRERAEEYVKAYTRPEIVRWKQEYVAKPRKRGKKHK